MKSGVIECEGKEVFLEIINADVNKLAVLQKEFDQVVFDRFPELKNKDNLAWKINALLVEMGECLQEWRGFKKWSKKQCFPITKARCKSYSGHGYLYRYIKFDDKKKIICCECNGEFFYNPLLEEYIDWLHFVLSVGLEFSIDFGKIYQINKEDYPYAGKDIIHRHIIGDILVDPVRYYDYYVKSEAEMNDILLEWNMLFFQGLEREDDVSVYMKAETYENVLSLFVAIGFLLGFEWDEIVAAYEKKNKVNHRR